jgi:hypothetical protein
VIRFLWFLELQKDAWMSLERPAKKLIANLQIHKKSFDVFASETILGVLEEFGGNVYL